MTTLYIRTVHNGNVPRPISIMLARTDKDILWDDDIISHFTPDTPGTDIKDMAIEYGHTDHRDNIKWGNPIYIGA